jgi:hypothetical protein
MMETKNNKYFYILLGIGAGIGIYYVLCNRFKNKIVVQNTDTNK